MSYNIAVVGATGNVGRKIIHYLQERAFPINRLDLFASPRSKGKLITFQDEELHVQDIADMHCDDFDLFFFAAGSSVSKQYAPKCAAHGVVIDKSSLYRMEPDIALIVPEVNEDDIASYYHRNIIASPNCVAIPVSLALKPLLAFNIKRVVITSLQSVSGAGKEASDELYNNTKAIYMGDRAKPSVFSKNIAFNAIPMIGAFCDNYYSDEENKIIKELQKILKTPIDIDVTSIRVPVFIGHSQTINIEFQQEADVDIIIDALSTANGVRVLDEDQIITPDEVKGRDDVTICRIRRNPRNKNVITLFAASDNLTKGAGLNAVQIAEKLLQFL